MKESSAPQAGAKLIGQWLELGEFHIHLIKSLLHTAAFLIYTLDEWNLDIQLTAIRDLALDEFVTSDRVLQRYPNLFTFSSEPDLEAGKEAFRNAIDEYETASSFFVNRDTNVVRLFNIDPEMAIEEQRFLTVMQDLKVSLDGALTLRAGTNIVVDASSMFIPSFQIRNHLPTMNRFGILRHT